MTVTNPNGGATVVDSGGSSVGTISVPRPSTVPLAVGDFLIVWGWVQTTVDWSLSAGADGVPWTKLWKADRFQIWIKMLGAGFGSEDTVITFPSGAHQVYGIMQTTYRGAFTLTGTGLVTGYGTGRISAPGITPQGPSGQVLKFYTATPTGALPAISLGGVSGWNVVDYRYRLAFTALLEDLPFTGTGRIGATSALVPDGRTFNHASGFTLCLYANRPPDAPTLVSPPDATTLDVSVPQRFSWLFNNPEGGNQSKFGFRYSDDAGATWTTITRTTANTYVDVAGATFTGGGSYQWQVRTYDGHGLVGPWSSSRFFTGADPTDAPVITYPTSGGSVSAIDRVDWTVTLQDDYQVRVVADDIDGNPDTSVIYFDTGDQVDSLPRTYPLAFPVPSRYEHIQVRVYSLGLWSDWADVRVLADYTPPPAADLEVTIGEDGTSIVATWTVFPPDVDEPPATSVDLEVSADGGATVLDDWPGATGLPAAGTAVYPWPASGVEHCVRATTRADNGATSVGEWISMFRLTVDEVV